MFTAFFYSPSVPLLVGELHPEHTPAAPGAPRGFGRPSSCCLEDDPSAEVIEDVRPLESEAVIRKRRYDAFAGSDLDGALRARHVTSLVVVGTMTDICVLATVVARSTRVRVTCRGRGLHAVAEIAGDLDSMAEAAGGRIIEEVIDTRRAGVASGQLTFAGTCGNILPSAPTFDDEHAIAKHIGASRHAGRERHRRNGHDAEVHR